MKKATSEKILSVIDKYAMLKDGDTVIVAVSGGADSMCLLHFFNKFLSNIHLNIICAHVNHGIRGEEADRDENFVRVFCEKNDISFRCAHYDIPAISKQTGESEEQCGRRLRYEFFSSIDKNAKIATAHHLNDSIETSIFNLARGTGLKGLTGISPVRGNIIRPLIECTREEIEEYLSENHMDYVTDSTNTLDDYSRNAIRHNVVPALKKINPGFESVFLSCAEVLSDTERYLEKITEAEFGRLNKNMRFSVSELIALDKVIRNRVLIKIASSFGAYDISSNHIELINKVLTAGGGVNLHGNVTLCSDGKSLYRQPEPTNKSFICVPFDERCTEYDLLYGKVIIEGIDKKDVSNYNIKKYLFFDFCDANKLGNAVFRTRTDGDRFRYPGAKHSKSLKNLFKEKGIPSGDRYKIPMLANDEHILWISGIGVSEYAKVTNDTKRIIKITSEMRKD